MIYPGDTHNFVLSLSHADGSQPSVTATPTIQIVNAATQVPVLSQAATMAVIPGSTLVYTYTWSIASTQASGDYVALVSYAADGYTFQGAYLATVRVGDSFILGPVALDATVAKNATVAKDATVAHSSDLNGLLPDNSVLIQGIKSKTDALPADPASLTAISQLLSLLTDVHGACVGNITIDRTVNPRTLTIRDYPSNNVIATFQLVNTDEGGGRTRTS